MDFWRTLEILNRRKWLILLSGIVAGLLMFVALRLIGSQWESTVTFISPDVTGTTFTAPNMNNNNQTAMDGQADQSVLTSIVMSDQVISVVAGKLGIAHPVLKNIVFEPAGPRVYQLRVTDPSPGRSADLANGIADRFLKVYQKMRTNVTQNDVTQLQNELAKANKALVAAKAGYDRYRGTHQVFGNLNTNVDRDLGRIDNLRAQRDSMQAQLYKAEASLQQKQGQLASLPAPNQLDVITNSPLAQKYAELTKANQVLTDLTSQNFLTTHPVYQIALQRRDRIAAEWHELWEANKAAMLQNHNPMAALVEADIRSLTQEVAGDQAQLKTLNAQIAQTQAGLQKYKGMDTMMASLAGAVAEANDLRSSTLARLNAAKLALDTETRNSQPLQIVTKINPFNPPVNLSSGRTVKLMIITPALAMVCACLIIIGLSSIDRRLRNVSQAEIVLPKRLLAAIPQPLATTAYSNMARITELQPHSLHSEAYRFLGMHLLAMPKTEVRSIMVLAAKAEQGSTTTLTNLGITLAQAGKRVIIVDANIRTSEVHTVFGSDNEAGFTDLLGDPSEERLASVIHETEVRGLSYITSGPSPENPWQLFRSQNLVVLSHLLHQHTDYVLYDTPSSLMFTDALNLAPVVDAAILCVRAQEPLTGTEERLVELLEHANVKVLGSVLSDVPTSALDGFQNYQHYYESDAIPPSTTKRLMNETKSAALVPLSKNGNGHRY